MCALPFASNSQFLCVCVAILGGQGGGGHLLKKLIFVLGKPKIMLSEKNQVQKAFSPLIQLYSNAILTEFTTSAL